MTDLMLIRIALPQAVVIILKEVIYILATVS